MTTASAFLPVLASQSCQQLSRPLFPGESGKELFWVRDSNCPRSPTRARERWCWNCLSPQAEVTGSRKQTKIGSTRLQLDETSTTHPFFSLAVTPGMRGSSPVYRGGFAQAQAHRSRGGWGVVSPGLPVFLQELSMDPLPFSLIILRLVPLQDQLSRCPRSWREGKDRTTVAFRVPFLLKLSALLTMGYFGATHLEPGSLLDPRKLPVNSRICCVSSVGRRMDHLKRKIGNNLND